MKCRIENGVTYTHTYNAENRASSIAKRTGDCATGTIVESWSFAYDGDGVRVSTAHFTGTSGSPDSTTSYFMGGQFEVKDGATKKYYSIAGMMVAVQDASGLQYLLTDHLGSTVAVTDSSGTLTSQQRYLPFGEERAIPNSPILATDFGYTGQRLLDSGMGGIMDYKARFYSPVLGKFFQPDPIIPNIAIPQNFNRSCYVGNNPLLYADPSGHAPLRREAGLGGVGSGGKSGGGCKDKRDLTDWLARALVDSANNPNIKIIAKLNSRKNAGASLAAAERFFSMVHNDAYFDVKWNIRQEVGRAVKIGNNWLEFSTPGNIMFGFYGSAAGFSPRSLYAGGGVAQHIDYTQHQLGISEHPEESADLGPSGYPYYGDSEDDHYAIQFGIDLYKQYQKTGELTASDLTAALDRLPYKSKLNLLGAPSNCNPTKQNFPTNYFYNE